jgi:hypothetical protein
MHPDLPPEEFPLGFLLFKEFYNFYIIQLIKYFQQGDNLSIHPA